MLLLPNKYLFYSNVESNDKHAVFVIIILLKVRTLKIILTFKRRLLLVIIIR